MGLFLVLSWKKVYVWFEGLEGDKKEGDLGVTYTCD